MKKLWNKFLRDIVEKSQNLKILITFKNVFPCCNAQCSWRTVTKRILWSFISRKSNRFDWDVVSEIKWCHCQNFNFQKIALKLTIRKIQSMHNFRTKWEALGAKTKKTGLTSLSQAWISTTPKNQNFSYFFIKWRNIVLR